jgi:hypothetical protein
MSIPVELYHEKRKKSIKMEAIAWRKPSESASILCVRVEQEIIK